MLGSRASASCKPKGNQPFTIPKICWNSMFDPNIPHSRTTEHIEFSIPGKLYRACILSGSKLHPAPSPHTHTLPDGETKIRDRKCEEKLWKNGKYPKCVTREYSGTCRDKTMDYIYVLPC